MFLNLGSGNYRTDGYCNVDLYAEDADVKASAFDLPFPDNHFSRAYLGHFAEHIEFELLPLMFAELSRVCEPGAEIMVVGPCMIKSVATGQPDWLLDIIRANPTPEMPGAGHAWTPTTELTLQAMANSFDRVEEVDIDTTLYPAWPNRVVARWQVAVRGYVR